MDNQLDSNGCKKGRGQQLFTFRSGRTMWMTKREIETQRTLEAEGDKLAAALAPAQGILKTAAIAKAFILGGNARVTLKSERTGDHYTFKIAECEDKPGELYFVSLLVGSDNESDYKYLGTLRPNGDGFKHGRKSTIGTDAPGFKAFDWFCYWLLRGEIKPGVVVMHEGRCGRCAHPLTHPDSILNGFGPECIKHVGFACEAA
jgi:Family of unknown function (DUF6011)